MVGHITYMSDESMREKFGRKLRTPDQFEVESYLKYRGYKFVDRFDANSYIYITRAMDTFDLTQRGALPTLFESNEARFLLISFTSDWLYPPYQSLGNRQRAARPELRRGVLQSGRALRARFVPGGSGAADRSGARVPGEHVPGGGRGCRKVYGRRDFAIIGELIEPRTRVLDLGCGEGELLAWLKENKQVDGRGVEMEGARVQKAIARGASVYQGDLESAVEDYPDQAFDYVVLSQTLQETRYPLACCEGCCASASAPSWRSRISGTIRCGWRGC